MRAAIGANIATMQTVMMDTFLTFLPQVGALRLSPCGIGAFPTGARVDGLMGCGVMVRIHEHKCKKFLLVIQAVLRLGFHPCHIHLRTWHGDIKVFPA